MAPVLGSLKHLIIDSLMESELPQDLYPYLAGCAPVRSQGFTGPGVGLYPFGPGAFGGVEEHCAGGVLHRGVCIWEAV